MRTHRIVLYTSNAKEKGIAQNLLKNYPDLFIWGEDEDIPRLQEKMRNNIEQYRYCYLRRGCNALFSDELTEVFS